MSEAMMVFDTELRRYVWHGGAYIDIGPRPLPDGEFEAVDVMNVWDYAKGAPRIEATLPCFQKTCERQDLEFEAQYTADDGPIPDELADLLREADADTNKDFEAAAEMARELAEKNEITDEQRERVEWMLATAKRINVSP